MFGIDEAGIRQAILRQVRKVHPTLSAILNDASKDPKVAAFQKLFKTEEFNGLGSTVRIVLIAMAETILEKPIVLKEPNNIFNPPPFAVLRPTDVGSEDILRLGALFVAGTLGLKANGELSSFNCLKSIWTTVSIAEAEKLVTNIPIHALISSFGKFLTEYKPESDTEKKDEMEIVRP